MPGACGDSKLATHRHTLSVRHAVALPWCTSAAAWRILALASSATTTPQCMVMGSCAQSMALYSFGNAASQVESKQTAFPAQNLCILLSFPLQRSGQRFLLGYIFSLLSL